MPNRAPPSRRYGARLYAADDGSLEIYDPSRRSPSGPRALVLGLTALGVAGGAAAVALALRAVVNAVTGDERRPEFRRRLHAPSPRADIASIAQAASGVLTRAESVILALQGTLSQAESAADRIARAAGQVRAATRQDYAGGTG